VMTKKSVVWMASVVAMSAGAVSAQTLKANVPFEFRVAGSTMPSGRYEVQAAKTKGGTGMYLIRHEASFKTVAVIVQNPLIPAEDPQSKLVFQCAAADCALSQIWAGPSAGQLRVPKAKRELEARQVSITLTSASAE